MDQVERISEVTQPHYTFLVVDAMTGQDAVTTAENFHQTLALDGVILTKLDGDARGGAALSVKEVVGKPIAFASTGEKLADFDLFHPERLAGRILGHGRRPHPHRQGQGGLRRGARPRPPPTKLLEGQFTFEDFLEQMQQVKKMGPLTNLIGMIPGVPKELRNTEIDDKELGRVEAMIRSMTIEERRKPDLIDGSRRLRIANGSGTSTVRGQRAAAAVQGDAADDEELRGHPEEEGQEGQEGRPGHAEGRAEGRRAEARRPARVQAPGLELSASEEQHVRSARRAGRPPETDSEEKQTPWP